MKRLFLFLFLGLFLFSFASVSAKALTCGEYSIISLWHFDEGSGGVAEDVCGVNEGTVIGSQNWTTGKYDGAFYFNHVDNWIDIGNDLSLIHI